MYSISFTSKETNSQVRAQGTFETQRKAINYAKKLAETFKDVIVWHGQPGGMRVVTLNAACDAERFGDNCIICNPEM